MDVAYFRMLADYNRWANEKVMARALELSDEEFKRPIAGLSFGGIGGSLAHHLGTEVIWLERCQGRSPESILSGDDFPDARALRERWIECDAAWSAFIATLTDEALSAPVSYRTMMGVAYGTPLAEMLGHVINHGTQFRTEAAVGLTSLGHSPGDLDLLFYLREQLPG